MTLKELIEKIENEDIEEVELVYEGEHYDFQSLEDFTEEVENYGLEEDKVKNYSIKKQLLIVRVECNID